MASKDNPPLQSLRVTYGGDREALPFILMAARSELKKGVWDLYTTPAQRYQASIVMSRLASLAGEW